MFRQGLWLCALRLSAGLPKQISYLRQPDGLGLRAYPISGLRIGFSLLSVRFPNTRLCVSHLSMTLLNEDAISGGRTSIGLAPLSLLPLRHRVSQRFCGSAVKHLACERRGFVGLRRLRRRLRRILALAVTGVRSRPRRSVRPAILPRFCLCITSFLLKCYGHDPAPAGSVIACLAS